MIERQIDILRERNVTMRKRMNELLQAARVNDEIFAKNPIAQSCPTGGRQLARAE